MYVNIKHTEQNEYKRIIKHDILVKKKDYQISKTKHIKTHIEEITWFFYLFKFRKLNYKILRQVTVITLMLKYLNGM